MTTTCDRCQRDDVSVRVVFTTEATDPSGIDVTVAKRWVTCPPCADAVFSTLSMPSPFSDADGCTVAFPDDEGLVAGQLGGFAGALTRA